MTMPGHEDTATAAELATRAAELATRAEERQSGLSRRSALRTAATAGIAATALAATSATALVATSAPALAAARPARADGHGGDRPGADSGEPIVAHLRNARTGEIDVFRGTSQTRLHDPALAALLIRASR
jgi:hypothetical protein